MQYLLASSSIAIDVFVQLVRHLLMKHIDCDVHRQGIILCMLVAIAMV
jgi:hypothetical protein